MQSVVRTGSRFRVAVELDPSSTDEHQIALTLYAISADSGRSPYRLTGFAGPRVGPASIWVRSHVDGEDPGEHVASLQDVVDIVRHLLTEHHRAVQIWRGLAQEWDLSAPPEELSRAFDVERDLMIAEAVEEALTTRGVRSDPGAPVVSQMQVAPRIRRD